MLPGLTEEQNKELKSLYVKAIDYAQSFHEDYVNTKKSEYAELAKCELVKARTYFNLGNFEEDPRYYEM